MIFFHFREILPCGNPLKRKFPAVGFLWEILLLENSVWLGGKRPVQEHRAPERCNPDILPQWRPAPQQKTSLGLGLGRGFRFAGANYVGQNVVGRDVLGQDVGNRQCLYNLLELIMLTVQVGFHGYFCWMSCPKNCSVNGELNCNTDCDLWHCCNQGSRRKLANGNNNNIAG